MCVLNPWSVSNYAESVYDFIIDQHVDVLVLTETWLIGTMKDNVVISALLPAGYSILQHPRSTRGGGTAVVYRDTLNVRQVDTAATKYESFESLECTVASSVTLRLCVVYRPPQSGVKIFCEEFAEYMSRLVTSQGHLIVVGDFNFHVNKSGDKQACEFLSLCQSLNLKQHVSVTTHRGGNTLDLVMMRSEDSLVSSVTACGHGFPDHFPVFSTLSLSKPGRPTK